MFQPGDRFGDYTVVRRLGKGGMGEVWLLESASGMQVAAKILDAESSGDHESRKRFLREAELALGVKHPNLVETYDVGEDPETGLCYILMEYVPNGTLADYLKENGALPIEDAVAVVQAMADVLELGRRKGIVHRDIKPANIMFDAEGTPKLADLGIARGGSSGVETTTVTQTGMMIGTPAYMSPEQMLDSHNVDTRADIYSLGVVFFEMLTGERPNKDDTVVQLMAKAVKGDPLPDVRTMRPEVSASLAQLLAMMVAPDKDGRISTPGQITNALAIIERGGKFAAPKPKPAPVIPKPAPRRTGFPWKALMPLVILGALGAAFAFLAPKKAAPKVVANAPIERAVGQSVSKTVVITNTIEKIVEKSVERVAETKTEDRSPANVVEQPHPIAADYTATTGQNSGVERPASDGKIYTAKVGDHVWSYFLEGDGAVISRAPRGRWEKGTEGRAIEPTPVGRVVIPSELDGHKVTAIGNQAFADCDKLTEIVVPEGVVELRGWGTFNRCSSLRSVQLPRSLQAITGWHVFHGCDQLEELDLRQCRVLDGCAISDKRPFLRCDPDNSALTVDGNGAVYSRDRRTLLRWPKDVDNVVLPDSVKVIGPYAFMYCTIWCLRIPDGVEEVRSGAFWRCWSLQEVYFPKGIRRIGNVAFGKCNSLRRVVFEGDAPNLDGSLFDEASENLTVLVKRGSKGWRAGGGEGLPKLWPEGQSHGRNICYLDEEPADSMSRSVADNRKTTKDWTIKPLPARSFDLGNGVKMEFLECPAGTFMMGVGPELWNSTYVVRNSRDAKRDNTHPLYPHKVKITRPFWMSKYPVTIADFNAVVGGEKYKIAQDVFGERSIIKFQWFDGDSFIDMLNSKLRAKLPRGYVVRYPTEAEFEYALKGGANKSDDVHWQVFERAVKIEEVRGVVFEWSVDLVEKMLKNGCADARQFFDPQRQRDPCVVYKGRQVLFGPAGAHKPNGWGFHDMFLGTLCLDRFGRSIDGGFRYEGPLYKDEETDPLLFKFATGNRDYRQCKNIRDYKHIAYRPYCLCKESFDHMKLAEYPGIQMNFRVVIGPDLVKEKGLDRGEDKKDASRLAQSATEISADAKDIFAWGVPMGKAITAASGGSSAKAIRDLTEKKIKANKDSIEKIGLALKLMREAKSGSAAARAMSKFESAVKAYHKKYVGGYGKWPLTEKELAGEQSQTAQSVVRALESVLSGIENESVKAVYRQKLEAQKTRAMALEARYRELMPGGGE